MLVAYELVKRSYASNIENHALESINVTATAKFYRSIEDFMGAVSIDDEWVNRFELVDPDISADIWEKSFALCEIS